MFLGILGNRVDTLASKASPNMHVKRTAFVALMAAFIVPVSYAGDLRIPLPKRSSTTPVQELNREGVEALRKNEFDKARRLFYKAYLFDPNDPFTLNNLGYISELEGQIDRAQQFYAAAAEGTSSAVIDRATKRSVEGKTVAEVAGSVQDKEIQVNRQNFEAIHLLSQGRAPQAELLLRQTLALEPANPFTLNNYAVANEMEGDYEKALQYYKAASDRDSAEPVIVTPTRAWRGKSISKMAEDSAKRLRERMKHEQSLEAQVRRLNLLGVSALNRNDLQNARQYFEQAYKLDPENPFVLNNRGYVAEMDGDTETAQVYYEKARRSPQADARVGLASRLDAEGKKLFEVADQNDQTMDAKMAQLREVRRRRSGPIVLKRRDNTPVESPTPSIQEQRQELGPPQPPVPQLTPQPSQNPPQQ